MDSELTETGDNRAATPLGVRILVIIVLICGLALVALPITVYLLGNRTPAGSAE
jgi:hypothetical protein